MKDGILVLLAVGLVFGATRPPQLDDGLGHGISNGGRALSSPNETEIEPKQPEIQGRISPGLDGKQAKKPAIVACAVPPRSEKSA